MFDLGTQDAFISLFCNPLGPSHHLPGAGRRRQTAWRGHPPTPLVPSLFGQVKPAFKLSLNTFIPNFFFTFNCYFNYTGLKEVSLIKSGVLPILGANRARNLRNASLISKDVEDLTF